MARKNHAPGAGGGKEKGRTAGDQQTGGVAGGKLGGSALIRDPAGRTAEAGRMGGQHATPGKEGQRRQSSKDESGE